MDPKYQNIQDFEKKLSFTFWLAFVAGVFHKAVTWFGSAALTWAMVVLMGGFASQIAISDFFTITLLVLLITILLVLGHSTCKLVTKKSLSSGSLQPLKLTYHDKRLAWVNFIKFISFLLQCFLLFYALRLSAPKIQGPVLHSLYSYVFSEPPVDRAAALASFQTCLQSCTTNHRLTAASDLQTCVQFCLPAQNSTYTSSANLQVCLITFHTLVISTCVLALLSNTYLFIRVAEACWLMYSGSPKTLSLMTRYHDEVLSRVLNIGLVEADEFDTTEFLLRGVAEDLVVRKIAPLEVKRQNEDFIKYLFYHPKGVEMVMGMLASEDTLLQHTAANMPGFWSSEPNMEKNVDLLSKLGEKLGMPGKVAEGAANSFKALAIAWKAESRSPLLRVYVNRSGRGQQRTSAGV